MNIYTVTVTNSTARLVTSASDSVMTAPTQQTWFDSTDATDACMVRRRHSPESDSVRRMRQAEQDRRELERLRVSAEAELAIYWAQRRRSDLWLRASEAGRLMREQARATRFVLRAPGLLPAKAPARTRAPRAIADGHAMPARAPPGLIRARAGASSRPC